MIRGMAFNLKTSAGRAPKPSAGKRYAFYPDPETGGLYLRVGANGSRAWIFRFESGGKDHKVTIGDYPEMDYHRAREIAVGTHGAKARGESVVPILRPNTTRLRDVMAAYYADSVGPYRRKQERAVQPFLDGWSEGTRQHTGLGDKQVADIKAADLLTIIRAYHLRGDDKSQWQVPAARLVLKGMRAAIELAMSEHAPLPIPFMQNPATAALRHGDLKARKVKGYKRGYEIGKVTAFRQAIDRRLAQYRPNTSDPHPFGFLMLEFGLLVGARPGEIARLRLEWLRPDNSFVVGKHKTSHLTNEDRVIRLSDDALLMLEKIAGWRKVLKLENGYVFPSPTGKGHFHSAKRHMETLREELGVDWTPHSLRSIFINALKAAGVDEHTTAHMIGDDPETVRRHYTETTPEQVDAALQKAASLFRKAS